MAGPLDMFRGTLGGALSGALTALGTYFVLDLGVKRRRDRHALAEAIAAELENAADTIGALLKDPDRSEIPRWFRIYAVVFNAAASRLGDLPYEDVLAVTRLYSQLAEMNRMPEVWWERAQQFIARDAPAGDPERRGISEAIEAFYDFIPGLERDCRSLGAFLRAKHTVGWRALLPERVRMRAFHRHPPASTNLHPSGTAA